MVAMRQRLEALRAGSATALSRRALPLYLYSATETNARLNVRISIATTARYHHEWLM